MKAEITRERQYLHNPAPMMALAFDIVPAPNERAIEAAIKATVAHHPLLCCKAAQATGGSAYFITTPVPGYTVYSAELEGEDDWLAVANDAEREPFDMENGELFRAYILEGQGRAQVVLCLHRIVGDASCLLSIARGIVGELEQPGSLGDPLNYHAPEPLEKVKVPMMTKTMGKMMNKRWTQQGRAMRKEDYLFLCDAYWQRESDALCHVFSKEDTSALAEICREKGYGLYALVSAALVLSRPDGGEAGYARAVRPSNRETDMGDYERTATYRYSMENAQPLEICASQIAASVNEKFSGEDERLPTLAFMASLEPTLIDAAYYSAYAGYADLMAAQARDMFGIRGSKEFVLVDLGAADYAPGRFSMKDARFLPQLTPTANLAVGMAVSGGQLAVSAQFFEPDAPEGEEPHAGERENFLDAMARLSQAARGGE